MMKLGPFSACTLLLLVGSIAGLALGGLLESQDASASMDAPAIGSDNLGYDLHMDMHYYDDAKVANELKRSNYHGVKLTLAGQAPDATGRRVRDALNPFVIGQKTVTPLGSLGDRWDVKQDANGNQYLALYHSIKGDYVVNKLRANLLREVFNAVKTYLPMIDAAAGEGAAAGEYGASASDQVLEIIYRTLQKVDTEIRDTMKDNDDSGAAATLVIITKAHIIVANAGKGKVVAYDSDMATSVLSSDEDKIDTESHNVFGLKKSRSLPVSPVVKIYSRQSVSGEQSDDDSDDEDGDFKREYQFLVLETPQIAQFLTDEQVTKTVVSVVKTHKKSADQEQELYSNSVTSLIQSATEKVSVFQRYAKYDFSILLVGLERNYEQIH